MAQAAPHPVNIKACSVLFGLEGSPGSFRDKAQLEIPRDVLD